MKTCITCKQEKELSKFPKRFSSKDGTSITILNNAITYLEINNVL